MSTAKACLTTLALAAALSSAGCTYGQVEWGGEAVEGATVKYTDCPGHTWTTQTDADGWYVFDGHENEDEVIPDGPYLIRVDLPGSSHHRLEYAEHYFTSCPDGSGRLCDQHDVDFGFVPASPWEWNAWTEDLDFHNSITYHTFHNEICIWTQF